MFLELLVYYWSKENLSRISSTIGKLIYVDHLTVEVECISFSRLFIEMDATQVLPTEIYMEDEGSILVQKIDYGWNPVACLEYKMLGP